jgi:hypothetical protein
MADEGQPQAWGLWNPVLEEWWNPGTRKPYFPSREEAHRMIPIAMRQYPIGTWQVRPYSLEEEATESELAAAGIAAPHAGAPGAGARLVEGRLQEA